MSAPQWLNGQPSYSVTLTPNEALEEMRNAVKLAHGYAESSERVRAALALEWIEWKLAQP
jgi:hypothetical protein